MSAAQVNAVPSRSDALPPLAARAMKATGADGVAFALKIGGDIVCAASVGAAPAVGSRVQGESTWSARCIREAQPISFSHSDERPGRSYSAILAPLLHAGQAFGCCAAFASRPDAFSPAHVRALVAIAASAVRSVTPEPKPQPAPPAPPIIEAQEMRPAPTLSAERLKEIEAELASFAAAEQRRARRMVAAKSALAVAVLLVGAASFVPDRVIAWAQPIVHKIENSMHSSPSRQYQSAPANAGTAAYTARN